MREQVHVALDDRSYNIEIGTDLLVQSGAFIAPLLRRKKVAIITDQIVAVCI